ncbi:MAG: acetylglutamate kinase [Actinomycetota bacterium]|nr:acetylglutamate kinase [Actinomycetota bacterium]
MIIDQYCDNENINNVFYQNKVETLLEALPYIKDYFNKIVIVKLGGAIMEDDAGLGNVLNDIVLMKYVGIKVILLHGGGKQITRLMQEKNIEVKFCEGLRITDEKSIEVVKMVLLGEINSKIVSFLNKHGKIAVGVSGNDASFIECRKKQFKKDGKDVELGFVGEITDIDADFINKLLVNDYVPVIATLGSDKYGNIYNINADTCASEIGSKLKAKKMILLTDVDGIKISENDSERLVSRLSINGANKLIKENVISKGMIPKVRACIDALNNGVERTHILNGNHPHSILIEIFTDKGIGTMIVKDK